MVLAEPPDPAAGLREVSCTRRVRFLWTDSTDRHSDLCSYPLSLGSVLRCHSCQTVLMAVVRASGRHRLGLLRNRNADARTRKHFRSLMGAATNNYWTYPAHPFGGYKVVVNPPSMTKSAPVTFPARSLASRRTRSATSWG